jgi:hypothetical protein
MPYPIYENAMTYLIKYIPKSRENNPIYNVHCFYKDTPEEYIEEFIGEGLCAIIEKETYLLVYSI